MEDMNLRYISGSAIRSELLGVTPHVSSNHKFWRESPTAETFDKVRLARNDIQDMAVDTELIEIAHELDRCVFDAWVMPWLIQEESLCVFLKSRLETRAKRLFRECPNEEFKKVLRKVDEKDIRSRDFFLKAYGVDIFSDVSPFDVIIECDERDDEASQCIAEISSQLTAIARPALSGNHAALERVVRSIHNHSEIVKTYVSTRLFERVAESVPA
jgi:cytidylate kinase